MKLYFNLPFLYLKFEISVSFKHQITSEYLTLLMNQFNGVTKFKLLNGNLSNQLALFYQATLINSAQFIMINR
jgi:hypothetical protein